MFRIVFTFFALIASVFCLILAIVILLVPVERLDKWVKYILKAMYVVFGPMMLIGCTIGFIHFD